MSTKVSIPVKNTRFAPSVKDKGAANRKPKVPRHNVLGMSPASVLRQVQVGGVYHAHSLAHSVSVRANTNFLRRVIRRAALLSLNQGRKTLAQEHLIGAMQMDGLTLCGYPEEAVSRPALQQLAKDEKLAAVLNPAVVADEPPNAPTSPPLPEEEEEEEAAAAEEEVDVPETPPPNGPDE